MKTTLRYPDGTVVTIKSKDEKLAFELLQEANKRMEKANKIEKIEKIEILNL